MKENITHLFDVELTVDQDYLLSKHFPAFYNEMKAEIISKCYELLSLSAKQEIK